MIFPDCPKLVATSNINDIIVILLCVCSRFFFPLAFSVLYIVTCRSLNRILGDWLVWPSIFATYSPKEMTLPIVRLQRQSPKSSHDFHQFRPILQPRVCLHLLIFQDPKVTLSFFRRSESSNYKNQTNENSVLNG